MPVERAPAELIGRDGDWRTAVTTMMRVSDGVGAVLLVAGEAGIGKTALSEHLYQAARAEGWRTAWATCAYGAVVPGLWPWRRIVSELTGEEAPVNVEAGDPVAARVALFDSISQRLAHASSTAPVLVVIDDAHWADPASAAMLLHVAATVRQARVCVVATYRPEDAGPGTALGGVLAGLTRLSAEVRLGPLGPDEVAALVAAVGPEHGIPDRPHGWLATMTGGNPLFITELLRLPATDWRAGVDGPPALPSVMSLVSQRLAGLPPTVRITLETAAVIGTEFDAATLARTLAAPTAEVLVDLQGATSAGITRELATGRFAFRHPLFRAALYDALGTAGRARAHAQVATALQEMKAEGFVVEVAALAHHFGRSAPLGNAASAVRYAVEAAREALASGAYETASFRFEQALAALELAPDAASRLELLLGQADAEAAAGNREPSLTLFERAGQMALEQGDLAALVRAALGRSGGAGMEVVIDDTARGMIDQALGVLGDGAPGWRAPLLARLSVTLAPTGSTTRRAELVREAVEVAAMSGSDVAQADADVAWCHLHAGPSHVDERIERAGRVVAAGEATGEVHLELLGRRLQVEALFEAGRFGDLDDAVSQYATRARLVREPAYTSLVPLWRATLAACRGDDRRYRMERAGLEGLIADESAGGNARLLAQVQELFRRLDHEGDAGGALSVFERISGGGGAQAGLGPQIAITHALLLAATGAVDEARRLVDTSAPAIRAMAQDAEWLPAVVQLVDLGARIGPHGLLRWAAEALAPSAEIWAVEGIGAAVRGPAARALAVAADILGDPGAAEGYAAQAESVAASAGVSPWWTDPSPRLAPDVPRRPVRAVLQREADGWSIDFGGHRGYVRHSKGMGDIARLLAHPGVEVPAVELAAEAGATVMSVHPGPGIDAEAKAAYQRRLAELDAELDRADTAGDARRSAALAAEKEMLAAELSRAFGLGGRARRTGSSAERARTAVTTRIRDALKRLDVGHPAAAAHLRRSVRTGTFCSYQPDAEVGWEVRKS